MAADLWDLTLAVKMAAILRNARAVSTLVSSVRNTLPRLSAAAIVHYRDDVRHLHFYKQISRTPVSKVIFSTNRQCTLSRD